jgi:DNA repair photolyase
MAKRISGTNEWSASTFNIQTGCEHGCLYCYASATAVRFKQLEKAADWTTPKEKAKWKAPGKRKGRIMFPSSHDITPANVERCLVALEKMLQAGNEVLIVSKPHLECVDRMTKYLEPYKEFITFRFTIGTLDGPRLLAWEPGAPGPNERMDALELAHSRGFKTSVSMEPCLAQDVDHVAEMVDTFRPFVTDAVWIGRANKLQLRVKYNKPGDAKALQMAKDLEATWSDERVRALYERLKNDPIVRWKDSVKTVMGIPSQEYAGQDI